MARKRSRIKLHTPEWNATEFEPKKPTYLMNPHLAIGFLTIVSASKGTGKTNFFTYVAAELSHSRNVFDSKSQLSQKGKTLFYSREEIKDSRLSYFLGFGGDRKYFEVDDTTTFDTDDFEYSALEQRMDAQWNRVKPQLVIIDTLQKFYGKNSRPVVNNCQRILERLAKKHHVAVVMLHHPPRNFDLENWCGGVVATEQGARYGLLFMLMGEYKLHIVTVKYQFEKFPEVSTFYVSSIAQSDNRFATMHYENENKDKQILHRIYKPLDILTEYKAQFKPEKGKEKVCKECGAQMICENGCNEDDEDDDA